MTKKIIIISLIGICLLGCSSTETSLTTTTSPTVSTSEVASPSNTVDEKWDLSESVTVTESDITYSAVLNEDKTASWIYNVKLDTAVTNLTFPDNINGIPVTRLGYNHEIHNYEEDDDCEWNIFGDVLEPWHGVYADASYTDQNKFLIETIEFPDTITQIESGSFCGLVKLREVHLPDMLEEVKEYIFANCSELKTVTFPANMVSLSPLAFHKSSSISELNISDENNSYEVKDGMLIYKDDYGESNHIKWVAPALKKITIPNGINGLEESSLSGSLATEIIIPKSVEQIGAAALTSKHIKKVTLEKGNKVYGFDAGTIYKKTNGRLIAVQVKKGRAQISSKVKLLQGGTSVMGGSMKRLDIPNSVQVLSEGWMFFENTSLKIYFHSEKPPIVVSEDDDTVMIPTTKHVYVPKGCRKAYVKWAKDQNLKWNYLYTF